MTKLLTGVMFALAAFSCKPSADNSQITEQEALEFIMRYDTAWNSKDSVTVKQLLGPNYLYFDSKGGTTSREETISIVGAPYYKVLAARREELRIYIHDNVATVSSRWIGNGLWKDQPFNDNQRCGLTLTKINGRVQLIAEHCVQITSDVAWD